MHGIKKSILEFAHLPRKKRPFFVIAAFVENILQKIISHFFPGKIKNGKDDISEGGRSFRTFTLWRKTSRYLFPLKAKFQNIVFLLRRSKVVCEDSDALLARALRENPGVNIPEPVPKKPQ